jgi:PAS domain S-box-containing protein
MSLSSNAFEYTLLRALAENVPHRIYAKDLQGRFIFANRAVAEGMGVSDPAELLGKTDFDFYPLELASEYNRQEQEVLRHGRSLLNQEEHAKYLLLEEEAWLMTTKVAVRDNVGLIVGLVGINYEVTAQKAAGLALQPSVPMTMRQLLPLSLDLGIGEPHRGYAQYRRINGRSGGRRHGGRP